MKKTLAISGLSLALILTACGQKDNQNQKVQKPINTSPKIEESSPSLNEESADKEGVSREEVRKLMTQSDYISRVKLTQLGDGQTELTILDNYKGSLSNIEFTEPKNLSTNKEYLIFYKDDADGNVVATSKDAVIEVASKNDTILKEPMPRQTKPKTNPAGRQRKRKEILLRKARKNLQVNPQKIVRSPLLQKKVPSPKNLLPVNPKVKNQQKLLQNPLQMKSKMKIKRREYA